MVDSESFTLVRSGGAVHVEPRVFSLLCLLISNHDRVVTKEEIVDKVWDGRAISDSSISTAIKALRRAVDDDTEGPPCIRTVHGRGFRFVAPSDFSMIRASQARSFPEDREPFRDYEEELIKSDGRPVIAVTPFSLIAAEPGLAPLAEAIPAELISTFSRLRWVRVIARGSSFRFAGPHASPGNLRSALGASYCIGGQVNETGQRLSVYVELVETASETVLWAETFEGSPERIQELRMEIMMRTLSVLEVDIPENEARVALQMPTEALDAWGHYHLGLRHMYRFNSRDNDIAGTHFSQALRLDPRFARAHAGLSFTCFQRAFMKTTDHLEKERSQARAHAERSLELDPLDPFGNYNLGRSYWLSGSPGEGTGFLERAVELSPSYAQGHYARAWTDAMLCRGETSLDHTVRAIELSPLDPMLYAMRSIRGLAHVLRGDTERGAHWCAQAARTPGSHFLIAAIAGASRQLNGEHDKAQRWADLVRERRPDVSQEHFFTAFPFAENAFRETLSKALSGIGIT